MKKGGLSFVGTWRITHMEAWDADYFDMEVPATLSIREDLTGEFQFGLVQAQLDAKIEGAGASSRLAFSWSGFDENDPVNGRGWLTVDGNTAKGRIFIHLGDESGFAAERQE
ncbi:MAG: hypothetical protein J0M01_17180 [Dechloromonas sp.]|nr:hypothetical protein [Dechloromonas sp.]